MDGCLFLLLRFAWFWTIGLVLGWGGIWLGWICLLTIIGIPFGLFILNRIPMIMTLQMPQADRYKLSLQENEVFTGNGAQLPLILRILYFLAVGWWFSLLWVHVAYLLSVTIIGLPIGFWMFNRLPFVLYLTRV